MKRTLQTLAVPAAVAASLLFGCSTERITDRTDPTRPSIVQVNEGYDTLGRKWGDQTNQPVRSAAADSVLLNFTGTITDIDYSNREMTLKGPQGRIETFVVDQRVQRLNEAKVGDKVSVDYYLGFNAEVRKPTAEEEQNPLVVLEAAGRAGTEADAGGPWCAADSRGGDDRRPGSADSNRHCQRPARKVFRCARG